MTVYLLPEEPVFPPVDEAEPDGLVAIGGDLSAERLLQAYSHGIFPWFKEEEDVYWYSPDPRLVLFPENFKCSRSLERTIKSGQFKVKFDTVFEQVIRKCAQVERPEQEGTWISDEFIEGYLAIHHHGIAHSVETFYQDKLVGGLYGVSLGAAFFGESMFFTISNASKVAFYYLIKFCRQNKFQFVDCQVETNHLMNLGAKLTPRKEYLNLLELALAYPTKKGTWIN
ncbi:MAG: leucyl/phenylalanyl-tRNA--protein transferase [Bacteroidales bacterium]|nr:leucyl/phenylalanyl-tRNA--protein transferase [Bacteroidales bacterium]